MSSWSATAKSRQFALAELCLVALSGAALWLKPSIGIWAIAASLIPWMFRFAVGEPPFQRTRFDLLLAIFAVTAFIGLWVSYDQYAATQKFYLLLEAALLYYALSSQPNENREWVSLGLFALGVGIAGYFFLTHDFIASPRKIGFVNVIGRWIMWARPELGLRPIHPNYVAGIAAIMASFGFYRLFTNDNKSSPARGTKWIGLGLLLIFSAILMATSRGVLMAIVAAVGAAALWIAVNLIAAARRGSAVMFPSILMLYLAAVVIFLYAGPAKTPNNVADEGLYGNGSRAELFDRSLYLVGDFPLTGGGLAAFPGLYSQYVLDIPIYYLPNSHNMFLDVFIEQGIFGGAAFLAMYLTGIWRISKKIAVGADRAGNLFPWAALIALIIAFVHGMVDDYLYQGNLALLSVALLGVVPEPSNGQVLLVSAKHFERSDKIAFALFGIVLTALIAINAGFLKSIWYSNLGAVQMARVELSGFPTNQWAELNIVRNLSAAEATLLSSVAADPTNRTANHRLGLIAMLKQDFPAAGAYLNAAHRQSPRHRGIVKALGYCYAWLGDFTAAKTLLSGIPEAPEELGAYAGWWQARGDSRLANNAMILSSSLASP